MSSVSLGLRGCDAKSFALHHHKPIEGNIAKMSGILLIHIHITMTPISPGAEISSTRKLVQNTEQSDDASTPRLSALITLIKGGGPTTLKSTTDVKTTNFSLEQIFNSSCGNGKNIHSVQATRASTGQNESMNI